MEFRRGWVGRRVDSRSTASSGAGGCTSGGGRRASDGARACDDCSAASAASTVVSIDKWGAGVGAGVVEVREGVPFVAPSSTLLPAPRILVAREFLRKHFDHTLQAR